MRRTISHKYTSETDKQDYSFEKYDQVLSPFGINSAMPMSNIMGIVQFKY